MASTISGSHAGRALALRQHYESYLELLSMPGIYCILCGPGGERIMDCAQGGTELELKTGSWAGRIHSQ